MADLHADHIASTSSFLAPPITPSPSWKLYQNPFYEGRLPHHSRSVSLGDAPSHSSRSRSPHRPAVSARKLAASLWEHQQIPLIHRDDDQDNNPASISHLPDNQSVVLAPSTSSKALKPRTPVHPKISHASASSQQAEGVPEKNHRQEREDMTFDRATLSSILQRVRSVEDNQTTSRTMIATLGLELEEASARLQELECSQKSALSEIDSLLRRFGQEMTISRRKEQDKFKAAFRYLREEIEEEKNTCRLLKIQNKKLARDLSEANVAAATAREELEREKQSRELMEDVCNELAREIGQDKEEVEELKREQAKVRERVEEERKMLRMAALWHEEKVRTKLSETQLELEGRNMALEDLRMKLEAFVKAVGICEGSAVDVEEQIEQGEMLRQALELLQQQQQKGSPQKDPDTSQAQQDGRKISANTPRLHQASCLSKDDGRSHSFVEEERSRYGVVRELDGRSHSFVEEERRRYAVIRNDGRSHSFAEEERSRYGVIFRDDGRHEQVITQQAEEVGSEWETYGHEIKDGDQGGESEWEEFLSAHSKHPADGKLPPDAIAANSASQYSCSDIENQEQEPLNNAYNHGYDGSFMEIQLYPPPSRSPTDHPQDAGSTMKTGLQQEEEDKEQINNCKSGQEEGEANINYLAPVRVRTPASPALSAKPLHCFWSPDASLSSTRRPRSPMEQSTPLKSNSLRAHLLKAREFDIPEKPAVFKGFRFSPLRLKSSSR